MTTLKELSDNGNIDKIIKKSGLSLALVFSKEELIRFGIEYGDIIRLNNAELIKKNI